MSIVIILINETLFTLSYIFLLEFRQSHAVNLHNTLIALQPI